MSYVDKGEDIGRGQNDGYLRPIVPKIMKVATKNFSYEPLRDEVRHDENRNGNMHLDLSDLSKYILTWEDVEKMKQKDQEEKEEQKEREEKKDESVDSNDPDISCSESTTMGIAESKLKYSTQEDGAINGENVDNEQLEEEPSKDPAEEDVKEKPRPAVVEKEELEVVRHKLLAASYVTGGPDLGKLFNEIDTDGDGVISVEELTHTVIRLVPGMSDAKLFTIMKVANSKGKGVLDKEDFYWFVGHTKPPPENDKKDEKVAEALIIGEEKQGEGYDESKSQDDGEGKREEITIEEKQGQHEDNEEEDSFEAPCRCHHTQFYDEPFAGKVITTDSIAPWKMDYNQFMKDKTGANCINNESRGEEVNDGEQKCADHKWNTTNNRRHSPRQYDYDQKGGDEGEDSMTAVVLETIPMAESKNPQTKGEDDRKDLKGDKAFDSRDDKYAADSK